MQWEEGVTVLVGSGLLEAAWARLPGRKLAGSSQSGKSPTGPGCSRLPLGHRGPGEAPGSNPPQPVAIWPSCSSRALLQTEFPEPAVPSLLRIHASFSHSPSNGCRVVFLSAPPAVPLWVLFQGRVLSGLEGLLLQTLASGLVGAPSLSLGVACLSGSPVLMSPVGAGLMEGERWTQNWRIPLGTSFPSLYSLTSELPCKTMWQIKT